MPVSINGSNTPTAGGAVYGDGTAYATTAAGTAGQVLTSAGASAPTWSTPVVPGATEQYSIVGQPEINGTSINAFTISGLASGLVYNNNYTGTYSAPGVSSVARRIDSIFWSSYYSCWVALAQSSSTSIYGIFVSKDGLGWRCIVTNVTTVTGGVNLGNSTGQSGMPVLAVDDSNGRFFLMITTGGNIQVFYSSIVATTSLNAAWTSGFTIAGDRVGGLMYCKMATTGASGIVVVFNTGASTTTFNLYTISAGTTTFTSRLSSNISISAVGWGIYQENGFIAVPIASGNPGRMAYNLSGDITTGWTLNNSLPPTVTDIRQGAVGNGYIVYISNTTIYWSTNGTTWNNQAIAGTALNGVTYTGSAWLAWDTTNTYISSTAAPNSTWSLYSGGVNGLRNTNLGNYWARRVTAT